MLASPVAYQSEPSAANVSQPVERLGRESAMGVQLPPPVDERKTPPLAPAAQTWPLLSATRPVTRPVTRPEPPLELEYQSR